MSYLIELNRLRHLAGLEPLSEEQVIKINDKYPVMEASDEDVSDEDYIETILDKLSINLPKDMETVTGYITNGTIEVEIVNKAGKQRTISTKKTGEVVADFQALLAKV